MLLKSCNRCGNLMPFGKSYCSTCAPIAEAEREARMIESRKESNKRYNQTRDQKYVRFYNSIEWRMLSAKYTQDRGYKCECCGVMATQVHHIKPIQTNDGWQLRLDYDNLKLLCTQCHNDAHDRFQRRMKHIRESKNKTK